MPFRKNCFFKWCDPTHTPIWLALVAPCTVCIKSLLFGMPYLQKQMSGGGAHQLDNLIITTFRRRLLQRRYIIQLQNRKESRPDKSGKKKIELLNEYNKIDFFSKGKGTRVCDGFLMCQPDLLVLFEYRQDSVWHCAQVHINRQHPKAKKTPSALLAHYPPFFFFV